MEDALVDLRRMAQAAVAEVHAPGEDSRLTVAATIAETSPAADGEGERQRQGEGIAGLDAHLQSELGQLDAEIGADQAGRDRLAVAEPQRQPALVADAE